MRLSPRVAALAAVLLAAALAVAASGQDKAPAGARSGVLNIRDCMDKGRNPWMAEIDQELATMQEAASGRASDLNPQERTRIRTKHLDYYNKRRLELYAAVVRIAADIAKERGFDVVQRLERFPTVETGEPELMAQIYSREVVHADPGIDITNEVLDRIAKEHAGRKK